MVVQIRVIGFVLVILASIHIIFPRYFHWKKELSSVSLINKQIMYVHTFFIAFVVLLMGLLCLTSAQELIQTNLGKKISLGLGVFWGVRLFVQFFGYSPELWKGKKFETLVHVIFSLLWLYLSLLFLTVYFI